MNDQISPYLKLVSAVIIQSAKDYHAKIPEYEKDARQVKSLRDAAYRWINSSAAHPFSFVWCAEALELDPDRLRKSILRPYAIGLARDRMRGIVA